MGRDLGAEMVAKMSNWKPGETLFPQFPVREGVNTEHATSDALFLVLDMVRFISPYELTKKPLNPVTWQLARWLVEYSDWRAIESLPDGWHAVLERVEAEVSMQFTGLLTGLHDKNGREIYEGDLLAFGQGDYVVGYVQWHGTWDVRTPTGTIELGDGSSYRVVGNRREHEQQKGG